MVPQASLSYELLVCLCYSFQFVIGSGRNMSDFTYVDNVAHANICAEQALCSNAVSVGGKVDFKKY
jgi:nucleoside-diphosphate-sugar epimerase